MLEVELLRPCWQWCANECSNSQQHATTSDDMQQGVQWDATCSIQQRWELLRPFET